MLNHVLSALVTLVVVVDPIGLAPVFVALTDGLPDTARRQVAVRACLIAAIVLSGAALGGDALLELLGIGVPAFQISGGLLLFWIAAEMVYGRRSDRESKTAEQAVEEHVRNLAAFPLAIPLMAGPGAIAATVLIASTASTAMLAALIGVVVAVCLLTLLVFFTAARIARFLGITGNIVLSRLLGVILAALAVQYVIDGVRAVLRT